MLVFFCLYFFVFFVNFVLFCRFLCVGFFSFERDFDLMTGLLLLFFLVYFKLAVTIA